MKTALLLSVGVLAIPSFVAAQNSAASSQPGSAVVNRTCPVSMQAKQGSGSGLVMVKKTQPKEGESVLTNKPGQHIHLIVEKSPDGPFTTLSQIASAKVTARGLSARSRLDRTPAVVGGSSPDLRRTLNVIFTAENDGSISAELDLPGFTSVRAISVESITLKDRSIWSIDGWQRCEVAPDPLMLIAAQ